MKCSSQLQHMDIESSLLISINPVIFKTITTSLWLFRMSCLIKYSFSLHFNQFFQSHHIPVALFDQYGYDKPIGFLNQGSEEFNAVSSFKFTVVRYLMSLNVTVLYSDSDIHLFHNPFPYLHSMNTDSIVFQKDGTICTGFFYIKPTQLSINLLDYSLQVINKTKRGDQYGMLEA